jgi:hypothetical protein
VEAGGDRTTSYSSTLDVRKREMKRKEKVIRKGRVKR